MSDIPDGLRPILRQVSRSFSLTLSILPASLRTPISLAYLLARAADTISDTRIVLRRDRLHYLGLFQQELEQPPVSNLAATLQALTGPQRNPAERELLIRLPDCFTLFHTLPNDDRERVRRLLLTITQGMQAELGTFPGEDEGRLHALESRADLERYTYFAAGCVGEFWTEMMMAHLPALHYWDAVTMKRRGIRFGQGLQMTNVLRDLAQDLRSGRCFLPRRDLAALGLTPQDLLCPGALERLRPLLRELLALTLAHYAEGWAYTLQIPPTEVRMRLACAWPLFIGLRTLDEVQRARDLLDPRIRLKISRRAVYAILIRSATMAWSSTGLDRYYRALRGRIPEPATIWS